MMYERIGKEDYERALDAMVPGSMSLNEVQRVMSAMGLNERNCDDIAVGILHAPGSGVLGDTTHRPAKHLINPSRPILDGFDRGVKSIEIYNSHGIIVEFAKDPDDWFWVSLGWMIPTYNPMNWDVVRSDHWRYQLAGIAARVASARLLWSSSRIHRVMAYGISSCR